MSDLFDLAVLWSIVCGFGEKLGFFFLLWMIAGKVITIVILLNLNLETRRKKPQISL